MLSSTSAVFASMAVATAAMLLMSGERWYADAASRPAVLGGEGVAQVLVVFQESDCPDDLRAVEDLLALVRRGGLEADRLGLGSGPPGVLGFLRRGVARSDRPIHRAILRSGIGSTPAALLLDQEGIVRYVHPLAGQDPRGHPEGAALALQTLAGTLAPGGTFPPGQEEE
jgi:hypothetical protein